MIKGEIPSASFHKKTRKALASRIGKRDIAYFQSADQITRDGDALYPYRQDGNFFYLTGIEKPGCRLLIFPENPVESTNEILFIPRPDPKKEAWEGKMMTADEASEISGVESVKYAGEFEATFSQWIRYADSIRVCHKEFPQPHNLGGIAHFAGELRAEYPGLDIQRLNRVMAELRMVKYPEEIEMVRRAISIAGKGFENVFAAAEPGTWEYELEAVLAKTLIENRCRVGPSIIATGAGATTLHYADNDCRLQDGDLVLVDAVVEFSNYTSDLTRCFPAGGKFSDRQRELYNGLLQIQESFIEKVKPGVKLPDLTKESKDEVGKFLKSMGIIKDQKDVSDYYMHNLGHHLGLDIHDLSLLNRPLEPGNVLTIEPGIYIKEESIGIRLEDDILVTESGCENLSAEIAKDIESIEAMVRKKP